MTYTYMYVYDDCCWTYLRRIFQTIRRSKPMYYKHVFNSIVSQLKLVYNGTRIARHVEMFYAMSFSKI